MDLFRLLAISSSGTPSAGSMASGWPSEASHPGGSAPTWCTPGDALKALICKTSSTWEGGLRVPLAHGQVTPSSGRSGRCRPCVGAGPSGQPAKMPAVLPRCRRPPGAAWRDEWKLSALAGGAEVSAWTGFAEGGREALEAEEEAPRPGHGPRHRCRARAPPAWGIGRLACPGMPSVASDPPVPPG